MNIINTKTNVTTNYDVAMPALRAIKDSLTACSDDPDSGIIDKRLAKAQAKVNQAIAELDAVLLQVYIAESVSSDLKRLSV